MAKLVKGDVYVDPALTSLAIAYQNLAYITELLMPINKVAKATGKYYTFDKSKFRAENGYRAPGDPAREVTHAMSAQGTYACEEHAFKEFVPDKIVEQADQPLNPEMDATEVVVEKILIEKEKSLATTMKDTNIITQNVTLVGNQQWSDYTNSDPISDIKTARSTVRGSILKDPNILMLGKDVFDTLCEHPDILDRIKYTSKGVITEDILAQVFKVEKVLVGGAYYNSAKEGQSDSLASIWGKNAWLVYVDDKPGARKITFGYHFSDELRKTEKWRPEGRKGTYVEVSESYDQKLVAAAACYLIKNAIA